jgi:pyruvate ferredoxin oxidoreductase alpha subunit
VIDGFRERGLPVGLARIRLFRPFPVAELRRVLGGAKRLVVFDRNLSFGSGGIMATELRGALAGQPNAPAVFSYVGGLGGRDVTPATISGAIEHAMAQTRPDEDMYWLGLKE